MSTETEAFIQVIVCPRLKRNRKEPYLEKNFFEPCFVASDVTAWPLYRTLKHVQVTQPFFWNGLLVNDLCACGWITTDMLCIASLYNFNGIKLFTHEPWTKYSQFYGCAKSLFAVYAKLTSWQFDQAQDDMQTNGRIAEEDKYKIRIQARAPHISRKALIIFISRCSLSVAPLLRKGLISF